MSIIAGSNSSQKIFTGQRKDFIVMRKDTFEYTGTYSYVHTDGTTVEYDFTGCVGMMMIKKKKTDTTAVKVIGVSFDEYEYTLQVDSDDMDLDAGKYFYDMQIYDADHKMVTKLYGNFVVLQDITDFEAVIELFPTFDIKSEVEYTFDDFKSVVTALAMASEIVYTFDDFISSTITILPITEITTSVFKFITCLNLMDIKSEVSYTYDDFIYLPMNMSIQSEVGYLQQYILTMVVPIYSEISYTIIKP